MVYPGDLLMLTSALRDLHIAYPGRFITDVDTTCREIWKNNPYVQKVNRADPHTYLSLGYPPYSHHEIQPAHLTTRYHNRLTELLGIPIPVTEEVPQIFMTEEEKDPEFVLSLGLQKPYWVVIAGAKYDTTTKWWNPDSYQEVIDRLAGRIDFVQCGSKDDWHLPLRSAVSMVGKTGIRKLVRLMYHADGVLCPVTFAMHLAAAVPTESGHPRAAVVVLGGRETPSLIQYPNQSIMSVIGQLPCCQEKGCWRYVCQETHVRQNTRSRCELPVQVTPSLKLAQCMEMITPTDVVARILQYYPGGNPEFAPLAEASARPSQLSAKRYAYTHPRILQELYDLAGGQNIYQRAVRSAKDFVQLSRTSGHPDLLMIGNLLDGSKELADFCDQHGIDRVYGEFGWFPHYQTVHADPLGFAWESSLCRMEFTRLTACQRAEALRFRQQALSRPNKERLPNGVRIPFVLWPLQLIGDRVNKFDLNLADWYDVLLWTRQIIPANYQLVIKDHPIPSVQSRIEWVGFLPDTILLDRTASLRALIENCAGVIGCNSTVLLESRLLYQKPTWAYGRSWYTGHPDLIFPVQRGGRLPHQEMLGKPIDDSWALDYGDWFLRQLLSRQYSFGEAKKDPEAFLRWFQRRSFTAFAAVGDDTFN